MSGSSFPLVVYLVGDREIHRPEVSLGIAGPLDQQVPRALEQPLAPPPAPGPVTAVESQVQLLRLDRLHQWLAGQVGWGVELLFVLTQQDDPAHARRDTWHLEPLLRRWCEHRGHAFASARLHAPPNRLDGAALELIEQLDAHLGVVDEVLLVSGGGPAALQIGAHVASFRGVRHRDALTVLQLEEVIEVAAAPDAASDAAGGRRAGPRRLPVDTRVRVVERFPGIVGRRAVQSQAVTMLTELDLPGAAQLLSAAGRTGLLADEVTQAADELVRQLSRVTPPDGPVAALAAALDLAELEWSRPGGSRAEALWYAALAAVALLPRAGAAEHPAARPAAVTVQARRRFNTSLGRGQEQEPLRLSEALLTRAGPLLAGAPARVPTGAGIVRFDRLFGADHRGDAPGEALVWLALLGALRSFRNDLAHELIALDATAAQELVASASTAFRGLLVELGSRAGPDRIQRLTAVRAVLDGPAPEGPVPHPAGSGPSRALATAASGSFDAQIARDLEVLLGQPSLPAARFAVLCHPDAAPARAQLQHALEAELAELHATSATLSACLPAGSEPALSPAVTAMMPASRLRHVCAVLVPGLPAGNRSLAIAGRLEALLG